MKHLGIDYRMQCYSDQHASITLKDHKGSFKNKSKCRLINESKIQVGRVSKDKLRNNQWRNTPHIVSWFKKLKHKKIQSFIKFDILEPEP